MLTFLTNSARLTDGSSLPPRLIAWLGLYWTDCGECTEKRRETKSEVGAGMAIVEGSSIRSKWRVEEGKCGVRREVPRLLPRQEGCLRGRTASSSRAADGGGAGCGYEWNVRSTNTREHHRRHCMHHQIVVVEKTHMIAPPPPLQL